MSKGQGVDQGGQGGQATMGRPVAMGSLSPEKLVGPARMGEMAARGETDLVVLLV